MRLTVFCQDIHYSNVNLFLISFFMLPAFPICHILLIIIWSYGRPLQHCANFALGRHFVYFLFLLICRCFKESTINPSQCLYHHFFRLWRKDASLVKKSIIREDIQYLKGALYVEIVLVTPRTIHSVKVLFALIFLLFDWWENFKLTSVVCTITWVT